MTKDKIIEKQKELIIVLTTALDFLADNNLIKEKKNNNDIDNEPLIDCVNKAAKLRTEVKELESELFKEKTQCPYKGEEGNTYDLCPSWIAFTNGCADCVKYHKNQ